MFKQIKDARNVLAQAPGMIAQAQQLAAAAQAQAAMARPAYGTPAYGYGAPGGGLLDPSDPRLAPIAGVTIETYAYLAKAAATQQLDAGALTARAASLGIAPADWEQASTGWPLRMRGDTALAVHYGTVYGQVGL